MGDRQQPHQHVAPLVELVPVGERAFQRRLHQVVGRRGVEDQRARIAPQARDRPEQLLAEHVVGLHVMRAYAGSVAFIPAAASGGCEPER